MLANIAKRIASIQSSINLSPDRVAVLQKSFDIFYKYNDTHYIVHHGQPGLHALPLNFLVNGLTTIRNFSSIVAEKNLSDGIYPCALRHPANYGSKDLLTPEEYMCRIIDDTLHIESDKEHRNNLIAGDINLASRELGESALHHFKYDNNRHIDKLVRRKAIREIGKYYIQDELILEDFVYKMVSAEDEMKPGAIMYTFCIPKEKFTNCAYLSQPYGVRYETTDVHAVIEDMQQQTKTDKGFPQVRLVSNLLKQNDVQVFMLPTCDAQIADVIRRDTVLLIDYFLR